MKEDLRLQVALVKGITAVVAGYSLTVKGPKGEVIKTFINPKIKISVENEKVVLFSPQATKREKTVMRSFESHIKNMVEGVQEPHIYKLKICSSHFPMNVSISGKDFQVKNFLGESVPRKAHLLPGVDVKVNGVDIIITSADKEAAGQMAGRIENLCRISNRAIRIFQDGCYINHKSGWK